MHSASLYFSVLFSIVLYVMWLCYNLQLYTCIVTCVFPFGREKWLVTPEGGVGTCHKRTWCVCVCACACVCSACACSACVCACVCSACVRAYVCVCYLYVPEYHDVFLLKLLCIYDFTIIMWLFLFLQK